MRQQRGARLYVRASLPPHALRGRRGAGSAVRAPYPKLTWEPNISETALTTAFAGLRTPFKRANAVFFHEPC